MQSAEQWTQDEIREQAEQLAAQEQAEFCRDEPPESELGKEQEESKKRKIPVPVTAAALSWEKRKTA